jgi:prepilin-type N-terminal cleavage/methylation domain-containing protein
MKNNQQGLIKNGFTLIELLVVIGIMGVLTTVLVVAINPGRQLAKARDSSRETDLIAILSAVLQYTSEHSGDLPDTDGNPATSNFPSTETCIGSASPCFNLAGAGSAGETIVPVYLAEFPMDPRTGTAENTGYMIHVDANGHIVASATGETKNPIRIIR